MRAFTDESRKPDLSVRLRQTEGKGAMKLSSSHGVPGRADGGRNNHERFALPAAHQLRAVFFASATAERILRNACN
jgi:hypothetical protein